RVLHVGQRPTEYSPADRFHPGVHRSCPVFLNLRDDSKLVREKYLGHVINEVATNPGVVEVRRAAGNQPNSSAYGKATAPAEKTDEASQRRSYQGPERSWVITLPHRCCAIRILGNHGASVDGNAPLA